MANFTSIVRLGHSGPDRGWVLVPLINEVIESQPAWSRLKVVSVCAQTAEDITASFDTLEEAHAWARLHGGEHLKSFKADWSVHESRSLLLDLHTFPDGGAVFVFSGSQVEAQGMPRLLEAKLRPLISAAIDEPPPAPTTASGAGMLLATPASVTAPRRTAPRFLGRWTEQIFIGVIIVVVGGLLLLWITK